MRRLHLLHRFLVVAQEGSLHAAAARLGVTQPALTKSIQTLEDEYGLALFDRHAKGVSLTTYGRKLMAHIKVIDRELLLADAELNFLQSGKSGMLNIGAGQTWSAVFLPPILVKLQKNFPEVHVNIWSGSTQGLLQHLLDGDIDVMIGGLLRESEDIPPHFTRKPLIPFRRNIVSRSGHPLQTQQTITATMLAGYPWVMFKGDLGPLSNGRDQIRAVTGTLPSTITYTESIATLLGLVEQGDYLSFMSRPMADALKGYEIASLHLPRSAKGSQSGVIYRNSIAGVAPFAFLLRSLAEAAETYLRDEDAKR